MRIGPTDQHLAVGDRCITRLTMQQMSVTDGRRGVDVGNDDGAGIAYGASHQVIDSGRSDLSKSADPISTVSQSGLRILASSPGAYLQNTMVSSGGRPPAMPAKSSIGRQRPGSRALVAPDGGLAQCAVTPTVRRRQPRSRGGVLVMSAVVHPRACPCDFSTSVIAALPRSTGFRLIIENMAHGSTAHEVLAAVSSARSWHEPRCGKNPSSCCCGNV